LSGSIAVWCLFAYPLWWNTETI